MAFTDQITQIIAASVALGVALVGAAFLWPKAIDLLRGWWNGRPARLAQGELGHSAIELVDLHPQPNQDPEPEPGLPALEQVLQRPARAVTRGRLVRVEDPVTGRGRLETVYRH
ncbi:hypothetical protein DL546_000982 [Coniochaeta pulveracea]|uniref:Uncharacterized protein n=1 Tax=Coniochaeta pulveracea TaxID=177199 RepID=A0A420XZ25_9PEZI|nr:hypothetical protein DL546_000982 [Coniochaeta pulveracea]